MGSLSLFIITLQEFVWRTDDCWLVTRISTNLFDPGPHGCVGKMPEVPRYQIVDAVRYGDGDMGSIRYGLFGNCLGVKQLLRQLLSLIGGVKKGYRLQC